jgi:hypothetical protein
LSAWPLRIGEIAVFELCDAAPLAVAIWNMTILSLRNVPKIGILGPTPARPLHNSLAELFNDDHFHNFVFHISGAFQQRPDFVELSGELGLPGGCESVSRRPLREPLRPLR